MRLRASAVTRRSNGWRRFSLSASRSTGQTDDATRQMHRAGPYEARYGTLTVWPLKAEKRLSRDRALPIRHYVVVITGAS